MAWNSLCKHELWESLYSYILIKFISLPAPLFYYVFDRSVLLYKIPNICRFYPYFSIDSHSSWCKCIKIQRTQVFWREAEPDWNRLLLLCVNVFVSKLWFLHKFTEPQTFQVQSMSHTFRYLLFCTSKIQNSDACFLWNILFDKTTVTILSTLMIQLPLS